MIIPNLKNYNVDDILRKKPFVRYIPAESIDQTGLPNAYFRNFNPSYDESFDPLRSINVTQSDFMREFHLSSHKINSIKYYPNPISEKSSGKFYKKVKTRIAVALQQVIHTKRVNCLTGNNVNIRITGASYNKDKDKANEMLSLFRECWENANVENGIFNSISSDMKVGDAAICFFMHKGKFMFRNFSFDNGDILYPHYDPITGKLSLLGRKFSLIDKEGYKEYLEVWDDTTHVLMSHKKEDGETETKWDIELQEGHGFGRIPVVYTRYGQPCWADSQSTIEKLELSLSQLAENNMAYALRILYSLGGDIELLSTLDGTPTQIQSPDPQARVGFLEPADSSKSFELEIKTLDEYAYKNSFAVKTPEIKSGSDVSSLTVKMLFADAVQKADSDAKFYQSFLDDVVDICKIGFGIEQQSITDFANLRIKARLYPYIFLSETEEVSNIVQLKSIGGLSAKSATEQAYELGYGCIDEYERILKEEHDLLVAESQFSNVNNQANGGI